MDQKADLNFPSASPLLEYFTIETEKSSGFKTDEERQKEKEWDRDRKRYREMRRREGEVGKERHARLPVFFFFPFPPSSPNQQLILGSDSAKIDFRKRVRDWKERERKTCGDFRNSSPKLFQMMLCCTLQNCSHTGCCSEGRQVCSSPRRCHTLSVI